VRGFVDMGEGDKVEVVALVLLALVVWQMFELAEERREEK